MWCTLLARKYAPTDDDAACVEDVLGARFATDMQDVPPHYNQLSVVPQREQEQYKLTCQQVRSLGSFDVHGLASDCSQLLHSLMHL